MCIPSMQTTRVHVIPRWPKVVMEHSPPSRQSMAATVIFSRATAVRTAATVHTASGVSANKERPARMCKPGECPFSCSLCLSLCQVVFDEVHRHAIANAIDLLSKKKKRAGGKAKEPDEKGLAVLSRVLAGLLENNLVRENQILNGRLEGDLIQDAMTNTALRLLQNPTYAIDLGLRRKLSKEVSLTRDVRLRDNGVYGGATAAVAGGVNGAAAAGGVVKVHSVQQAR